MDTNQEQQIQTFPCGLIDPKAITEGHTDYYVMSMHRGEAFYAFDFNGQQFKFIGEAEPGAQMFLDFVADMFPRRLQDERQVENEECAKLVDHIARAGGGTQGDTLRERYALSAGKEPK